MSDRKSDHSISSSLIEENKIRIISYSLSSASYSGNDGILFYLPIEIPDTLKPNIYTLTSLKTVISNVGGTNIAQNLSTFGTIKVGNFTPNSSNDSYTTDEDVGLTINATYGVLANDNDIENNSISAELVSDVSNGTLTLKSDGSFEYTPNLNYFGSDSFTYKATDAYGSSESATVNITVTSVNDAPQGTADNYFTDEDVTLTANATNNNVGVLSNDTDVENDTLTATLVSTTSYGSLTFNLDGTFQYTPNANYFGSDGFTYKASDEVLETDTINVTITVNSVNDAPLSSDVSTTTDEDTEKDIILSATDVDGDVLTYSIVSNPSNGLVTISGSTATYTPSANYNGSDSFTYKVNDGSDDSNTSDVDIIITAVDDAPIALPDFYITEENIPLIVFTNVGITSNDIEVENQALTINLIDDVSHGSLILDSDGSFSYTPSENYFGEDTFTYTISDGLLTSDTATVTIEILEINYPPVTNDISQSTAEDTPVEITLLATDQNGDNVSFNINNNPSNGSLFLNEDKVTYSPNGDFYGVDTFTYSADDGRGGISNISTVTITVDSVYDVPLVTLEVDKTSINEEGGEAIISAVLAGVDAGDAEVTINLSTSGTASAMDYSLSSNSITIPKSDTTASLTLSSTSDTEYESDEDVVVSIESTQNANEDSTQEVTVTIIDDDKPLGIENKSFINKVYPNPTANELIVEFKDNHKVEKVEFIDFSGKIITPNKVELNNFSIRINVSNLNEGIYLLNITRDKEINKIKIVIKR